MPIQLTCPACQRQLRVPDNLVGQMVKCPGCKEAFKAVVEEAPPAVPEPPPSRRPPEDDDRYREEAPPERRVSRRDDDDLDEDDDRGERRGRRRSRRNLAPHRGTIILVLGILSWVGGTFICGIIAWIMGNNDLKEIRAGRMDPEGESQTNIGRMLGMVNVIFAAISLFICCPLYFIFVFGMMGAAGHK